MYLILGLGVSNKAVVTKLKELNKDFIVVVNEEEVTEAFNYSKDVITFKKLKYVNFGKVKYVIKSPGIPYYNEYIRYLKAKHLKIINEIELTYILAKRKGKYIGVSGSAGKSSVVSMLHNLVKVNTDNVILAGNIGTPLINYLEKINKETIVILEISSFQLDDFKRMKFDIALLLNIYDNHLDFYKHRELYYLSKFKLTNNQTKNNYFIVNLDNQIIKKYLLSHCFKSKLIDYKSGFNIANNYLYYFKTKLINLHMYSLKGEHNLDNLMAVITIITLLNITLDTKVLAKFETLDYHLQEIKGNKITIINDSKSTCASSLKCAIETYKDKNIILLFGGYNKNLDFSFLNKYKFKYLICFGSLTKDIDSMSKVDIKFDNLREASNYAFKVASKEDVILFSPGCASFDEFKNYIERGETFNNYIKEYYHE